jgi:hypothetical protein
VSAYFCGLCGEPTDSCDVVRAVAHDPGSEYHLQCARQIAAALAARGRSIEAAASGDFEAGDGTKQLVPLDEWRLRQLEERVEAIESLAKRSASVWKLWLNDAEQGRINQGTFHTMRSLLGIDNS